MHQKNKPPSEGCFVIVPGVQIVSIRETKWAKSGKFPQVKFAEKLIYFNVLY